MPAGYVASYMITRMLSLAQYPVVVGGLQSRVLEAGDGDRVVLCLHGSGSRADRWRPAMALLAAAGWHCFAIDFPGHGLAAKPAGFPYGSAAFADLVGEYLQQLGDAPIAIAGTSIGGHVAGLVALAQPSRVSSLCLIGSVGLADVPRPPLPAGADVGRTGRDAIRSKLEFLMSDDDLVTDDWITEEWRINSSPGAAEALAALQADNSRPRRIIGPDVAALGIPTMLCWGVDDVWVPASDADACRAALPGAPLLLLDRAGHAPYFERPRAFCDVYLEFLTDPRTLGDAVIHR